MGKELTKREEKALAAEEWKKAMPAILSKNIALQQKALKVVDEKLDQCSAAQAATVYGILHDKCRLMVGQTDNSDKTFNMYFGGDVNMGDTQGLLNRVLTRMKEDNTEMEVVEKK